MEPTTKHAFIDLLHKFPPNLTHNTWNSEYRHIIASRCIDIIGQASREDFRVHNPIYCQKVQETCVALIKKVKGAEVEEELGEWPHNIDWFDSEDHLFSFTGYLVCKAQQYAPEDGLLTHLQLFMEREAPCCSYCLGLCHFQPRTGTLNCTQIGLHG